jgi:hypothetical protein
LIKIRHKNIRRRYSPRNARVPQRSNPSLKVVGT